MSQRNPLNERYQNTDDRKGTTRKSAASAKPATKAAASVRQEGHYEEPKGLLARATQQANKSQAVKNSRKKAASKATVERRKERAIRAQYYNPDTPEYKKWRKVWWGMLAGAIATTLLAFWASSTESYNFLTIPAVSVSYVLLFVAIVFDFMFLRKMRTEYQDKMIALEKSKKNSAKRKEAAAAQRAAAQEAEENPPEDRKLFRGLFSRKRASDAVAMAKNAQANAAGAPADAAEADAAKAIKTAKATDSPNASAHD